VEGPFVFSKGSGWRVLGVIVGIDVFCIGVAALTIPDQSRSWGTIGGVLSIAVSVG
jgi:hypothetical protein